MKSGYYIYKMREYNKESLYVLHSPVSVLLKLDFDDLVVNVNYQSEYDVAFSKDMRKRDASWLKFCVYSELFTYLMSK